MPKPKTSRKTWFRVALAFADMTQTNWAMKEGFTISHLSHVLNGAMLNEAMEQKIDAFTDKQVRLLRRELDAMAAEKTDEKDKAA